MKTIREDDPGVFAGMEDLLVYLGKSRKCKFIFTMQLKALLYGESKPENTMVQHAMKMWDKRVCRNSSQHIRGVCNPTTAPDHAVKPGEIAIQVEITVG